MSFKMAWNKQHTSMVVLNKVKEYTLTQNSNGKWSVRGWYNKENYFLFAEDFETLLEVQEYLAEICKKIKTAWNKERTAMVVLNKIKEYTITDSMTDKLRFTVRGWFNKDNCFVFGDFLTLPMAQYFLDDLNRRM